MKTFDEMLDQISGQRDKDGRNWTIHRQEGDIFNSKRLVKVRTALETLSPAYLCRVPYGTVIPVHVCQYHVFFVSRA
jgi:hypothetical protein